MTCLADAALDRSVVLGYGKIGSSLRRRWWPADPDPGALSGKRVLVTGATSGIGEAMARSFADLGAVVHLLGRNRDKLARVAAQLRLDAPNAAIVEEVCDVADLDLVRTWAASFTDRVDRLHGLVHNAGTMTAERQESRQGHELQLATHVLGPHLMTELLLAPLLAGPGSVVWMSSGGMYSAALPTEPDSIEYRGSRGDNIDDVNDVNDRRAYDGATYDGVRAYARTKRMQVVLAQAWARRTSGSGLKVESMHPGWVRTSGVTASLPTFDKVFGPILRTPADGADTAVWLVATRPASIAPHFWHDRAQRPTTFGWQRSQDERAAKVLLKFVSGATGTAQFL